MRALILRRVSLIQGGVGGPVLIGPSEFRAASRGCRISSPATAFRIICSIPSAISDAAELIARYSPSPDGLAAGGDRRRHRAAQSRRKRARARARHDRRPARRQDLRRRDRRLRSGGACDRGLCRLRRAVGGGAGCARLRRAGRRQRAHRELSRLSHRHLRPGAGRPRLQPGAEVRRRHHDPDERDSRSIARATTAPSRWRSIAATRCARARSWSRAARATGGRRSRTSTSSRAAASGTGPRRSRRGCAPSRRSCWSAAATRRARPRCSCRATRARSA